MGNYPDYLAERDYLDEAIGPQQEDERINDNPRWIGVDQAVVNRLIDPSNRRDFVFGDSADYTPSDEDLESNDEEK